MARFDASRRLPAAIAFTLVSACSGGKPAAPAPTPAAGHATAGTRRPGDDRPGARGVRDGRRPRHADPDRRAGPTLLAAVGRLQAVGRAQPGVEAHDRLGDHHLQQPLAGHPPYRLRPAAAEHLRPQRPPQHGRPVVRRRHRVRQGGRAGHHARGGRRRGPRLRGERHDHAAPAAEAARAGWHGRPGVRLEAPRAARRRAARRPGRRGLLHELLVPADGGVRRRERLADRPVRRQRRVLHGLRQLRREPHAARPAGWSRPPARCRTRTRCSRSRPARGSTRLGAPPVWCTWSPTSTASRGAPPPPARTESSPGTSAPRTCAT